MGKSKKNKIKEKEKEMKIEIEMKSLPEDIITSILAKLPVKPLMRFRCVCKSWNHLIKNPNFIEMHQHSNQDKKNECILIKRVSIMDDRTEMSFHSYESLNEISPRLEISDDKEFEVSWPCNGLLLCVSVDDGFSKPDPISTLILCNPATREFKRLPPTPFHVREPRLDGSSIGLGFDSIQNDYKVVTIEYKNKAQIYNLSSDSWRQIKHEMPYLYFEAAVPFNGALHWSAVRNGINIILSFDVNNEVFQDTNLPEQIAHSHYRSSKILTLLNDCLAIFTNSDWYSVFSLPKFVGIWVLKEGSWTKQISVDKPMKYDIFPRLVWKNEAILFDTRRGKLKSWALDTNEVTDTGISREDSDYARLVMVYKESLVSIQ